MAWLHGACWPQLTFRLEPIIKVVARFTAAGFVKFVGAITVRLDAHFSGRAGSIVGNRRAVDFRPLAPFSGHGYFPLWLLLAFSRSNSRLDRRDPRELNVEHLFDPFDAGFPVGPDGQPVGRVLVPRCQPLDGV